MNANDAPGSAPPEFRSTRMPGAVFDDVDLSGASFHAVDLSGAVVRESGLVGTRFIGVEMENAVIEGEVTGMTVNGVDIAPLVEAELDRRHPGRALLRSDDPGELRAGWAWLVTEWAATVERALEFPETALRLQVDGEWSFLQTLRHLVFATDSWLGAGVLGSTSYHPLGIAGPWFDNSRCGLEPDSDPSTPDVLAARAERQSLVGVFLESVTAQALEAPSTPPASAPWPPFEPMPVLARLHIILNEEWWHLQFVRRDMQSW